MADEYERTQMAGAGEVLYRYRVTSPPWLLALAAGLPGLGLFGAAIATAAAGAVGASLGFAAGGVALVGLMSIVHLVFAVGRIAVSEGELHVQMGLWGPRIPIRDIASAEAGSIPGRRIGMGAGYDLTGRMTYRMWGDNAKAVLLTLTSGKKIALVMKEPDALLAAIRDAMGRASAAAETPRVRVEAPDEDEGSLTTDRSTREQRRISGG